MFKAIKNRLYEKTEQDYADRSYQTILKTANTFIEGKPVSEQIQFLDYLINSLLDDVCTSTVVLPIMKRVDGILDEPFPFFYYDKNNEKCSIFTDNKVWVKLSENEIYVRPWDNKRTANNLKTLTDKDFVYFKYNHLSYFYNDINLCYVYNGNHSINIGRYLKKGKVLSDELNTVQLYSNLKTDGRFWYNIHTNGVLSRVSDFRLAAVYSLAQMRYDINCK